MRTVILSWSGGIKQYIVFTYKFITPVHVTKYPVPEGFPHGILLLCSNRCLLFIENPFFFAILDHCVIHTAILQIQGVFQNLIRISPAGSICHVYKCVSKVRIFPFHIPLPGHIGILDLYHITI